MRRRGYVVLLGAVLLGSLAPLAVEAYPRHARGPSRILLDDADPNAVPDWVGHDIGNVEAGLSNRGEGGNPSNVPGIQGFEYPAGSGNDFLFSAGLWVGAMVNGERLVSTCTDGDNGTHEFWPVHIGSVPAENVSDHDFFFSSDSFDERLGRSYVWGAQGVDDDADWVLNADDLDGNGIPSANWDGGAGRIGVDDDVDGLIDEELANNVDDDGDDLIDEDCSNGDANGDHDAGYDPEWHVDEDGPGDRSADRFDNDADGLVDNDDPDWDGDCCPGSLDDDGDGQNDEDAAARSSQEFYCVYQDSIQAQYVDSPDADGHTPLDIEVTQHSYGFDDGWRANMVLYEFTVANRGTVALDSVHLAFFADADILAQGEPGDAGSLDDGCFFDESHQMMVQYDDPDDADGAGPGVLGIKFVVPPIRWQDAQFSFRNFERTSGGDPETNASKFALISSGQIDPPVPELGDWRMLMGFGGATNGIQLLPGAQISFSVGMIGAADTAELAAIAESLAVGDMVSHSVEPPTTVAEFRLLQNYPNPFNSSTAIEFVVPRATRVTLSVYDITGREAATLADQIAQPGLQRVIFDASKMASGVYFYVLRAGDFSESRKMLLIR